MSNIDLSFWSGSAFCFSGTFWSGGEVVAREKKIWSWRGRLLSFSKVIDFLESGEFFFWGFKIFWKLRIFVSFLRGFFGVKTLFVSSSRGGLINFSKKSFPKALFFLFYYFLLLLIYSFLLLLIYYFLLLKIAYKIPLFINNKIRTKCRPSQDVCSF